MTSQWRAILQLIRFDKPIGSYLLLWPTLSALWIASAGMPSLHHLLVFSAGVFVMRSAGCAINDIADRKVDGQVKRTNSRPLVNGSLSTKTAFLVFFILLLIALMLVLTLNTATMVLSLFAVILAASYPFMKRITHLPQVVLGAAFSWSIPMAFAAVQESVPAIAWLLFCCNLLWTVAYDTMYAMVDRDDDLKIGVRSTAILFGRYDTLIIALLQSAVIALLVIIGSLLQFDLYYYVSISLAAALFVMQQKLIRTYRRENCFKAFLNNHYGLLIIFAGIVLQYLPNA